MTDNVVGINKNRIILRNIEVAALLNIILFNEKDPNPVYKSFQRISKASKINGKLQYKLYGIQQKLNELGKNCDAVRMSLVNEFCDKDEDGTIFFTEAKTPTFTPEAMAAFNKEFGELMNVENVLPFDKVEINSSTLEQMNSKYVLDNAGKTIMTSVDDPISIEDMIILEFIFIFKE